MPEGRCPACSAPLQWEEGQESLRCPYCGVLVELAELAPEPPPPPAPRRRRWPLLLALALLLAAGWPGLRAGRRAMERADWAAPLRTACHRCSRAAPLVPLEALGSLRLGPRAEVARALGLQARGRAIRGSVVGLALGDGASFALRWREPDALPWQVEFVLDRRPEGLDGHLAELLGERYQREEGDEPGTWSWGGAGLLLHGRELVVEDGIQEAEGEERLHLLWRACSRCSWGASPSSARRAGGAGWASATPRRRCARSAPGRAGRPRWRLPRAAERRAVPAPAAGPARARHPGAGVELRGRAGVPGPAAGGFGLGGAALPGRRAGRSGRGRSRARPHGPGVGAALAGSPLPELGGAGRAAGGLRRSRGRAGRALTAAGEKRPDGLWFSRI